MKVLKLYLKDFLSYGVAEVAFSDGLNVIVGENAVGKTNLMDSVYLASLGKSSRGYKDKELIRWGSNGARMKLLIEKEFSRHTVEIAIDAFGKKRILVDDLPIGKLGELLGILNVVFFSPDELKLVKESPDYRRRFMDISLSQLKKRYFYELVKYNKLLSERNALLKCDRKDQKSLVEMVTKQMIPSAKFVTDERLSFLSELSAAADERHKSLTDQKEGMTIAYQLASEDESELYARYQNAYQKDKELRYTTVGPHRDDLKITVGGVDIRKFGSQGQQRTAVLAMKLAEAELFLKRTGETPILLLDDVLSELDLPRTRALLKEVANYQTILTCTRFPESVGEEYLNLEVKDNTVRSERKCKTKRKD